MAAGVSTTNFNTQQIFLGSNIFESGTYTNSSGSTVTIAAGTLIGQVLATGKLKPHISSATDGSEMPVGFAAETYTVADGADAVINICVAGDVNKNAVTLGSGDTWSTAVRTVSTGGGTIEALVRRNTTCTLYASTELSAQDTQ